MTTKQKLAIATKQAKQRLIEAADAALVAQGRAARARQRKRARKTAFKAVAKTLAFAGAATAAVSGARAGTRALRRRAAATTTCPVPTGRFPTLRCHERGAHSPWRSSCR